MTTASEVAMGCGSGSSGSTYARPRSEFLRCESESARVSLGLMAGIEIGIGLMFGVGMAPRRASSDSVLTSGSILVGVKWIMSSRSGSFGTWACGGNWLEGNC